MLWLKIGRYGTIPYSIVPMNNHHYQLQVQPKIKNLFVYLLNVVISLFPIQMIISNHLMNGMEWNVLINVGVGVVDSFLASLSPLLLLLLLSIL
jgi:hypothetical protein